MRRLLIANIVSADREFNKRLQMLRSKQNQLQMLSILFGVAAFFFAATVLGQAIKYRDSSGTGCGTREEFPALNTPTMSSRRPTIYLNWDSFVANGINNNQLAEYEAIVERVMVKYRQAHIGFYPTYGGVKNNTTVSFGNTDDEEVALIMNPSSFECSIGGCLLAVTNHQLKSTAVCSNPNDTNDCTLATNIVFNKVPGQVSWATTPVREMNSSLTSFQNVLTHELGHAFGMCHMNPGNNARTIMRNYPPANEAFYGLFDADVAELKRHYGTQIENNWTMRYSSDSGNNWSSPRYNNLDALNIQTTTEPSLARDGSRLSLAYSLSIGASGFNVNIPCILEGNTSGIFGGSESCYFHLSTRGTSIDGDDQRGYMMAWVDQRDDVALMYIPNIDFPYSYQIVTPPDDIVIPNRTISTPAITQLPGSNSWALVYAMMDVGTGFPGWKVDLPERQQACADQSRPTEGPRPGLAGWGTCATVHASGTLVVRVTSDNGQTWSPPLDLSYVSANNGGEQWRTEGSVSATAYREDGDDYLVVSFTEGTDGAENPRPDTTRTIVAPMVLSNPYILTVLTPDTYEKTLLRPNVHTNRRRMGLTRVPYPRESNYLIKSNSTNLSSPPSSSWSNTATCTSSGCGANTPIITSPAVAVDKGYYNSWLYMLYFQEQ